MKLQFSSKALAAFELVKKNSPELAEKIKLILKDMLLHPAEGVGEPVCLNGEFKDVWQRKISHNEYINYMFNNEVLVVISIQVNESTKNLEASDDLILKEFDLPPEKTQPKYAVHWDIGMSWR